ncbi:MAG: tetratricopeptide repeat protein [Planctomycetota bacterium]|jgi:Tfp pilus assembly protein PilF
MNVSRALVRSLAPLLAFLAVVLVSTAPVYAQEETPDDLAFVEELRTAFRRGGSYAAQRDLEEYLEDFPASPSARRLAAEAAQGRGRLDEALGHLDAGGRPDPVMRGRLLLRLGRAEAALELAGSPALDGLAASVLEVYALDALGRRNDARRAARAATDAVDDRTLDGHGLLDLARLLLFQRRFELANQALVFADVELNGKRGPKYRLVEPAVPLLLGEVYAETRQEGSGSDPSLTVLNEVLDVDPGHPDALVTKARVYIYGMNGRAAESALDQVLSRDPTHPGALLLRGRTRLTDRRVDAALAAADAVLAVDPRARDALALRAAALAVTDREEEARLAREAYRASHPESAAFDRLLGEVLQSHYRFAESIAPLEAALALEPEDERPLPVLAQSLAHVGRETEARAALEEHARRSPFPYPWRNNMLAVLDKLADSAEIITEGPGVFRLRMSSSEVDVLGVLLSERLGRAREDLAERWGVDPEGDVVVEVFDKHADFSVRTVGFQGFLALGACFGRVMTMLSPLCELRGQFHWAQTAVHEYAHVVTLELSNQRVPRWLTEGVSVVEEKRVDPSWARELDRPVLDARANGMLLPVVRLDEAFRDGSTVMLGYYQGSLLCEVIERDFGFEALRDLVASYADGRTTRRAVEETLGVPAEDLDRRLLAYVDEVVAARAVIRPRWSEAGKELLRDRVAAGDDEALLDLAAAYHDLGAQADGDAALRRYLDARGETPAAARVMAERDASAGRLEEARERLLRWASEGRPDADGLTLLARLELAAGRSGPALEALRRARTLYPGDVGHDGSVRMLYELLDPVEDAAERLDLMRGICAYDETALRPRVTLAEHALAEDDVETALRRYAEAVEIDPYRPDLRMLLADLLAGQGRTDEARRQWRLVLGMRSGQESAAEHGGGAIDLPWIGAKDEGPTLEELQGRARSLLAGGDAGS